ncbi:DUF4367 domain-containing protein [Paenibacillus sacheonensis]|uniref:DUF4367 domain-containing protein n=1 Tax=Paenibacillus sacheonensis TaxID=742054 RepID=A0A7X4YTX6_9BACL|nr:DUF4367 domain-containing protein [Paenibacillus sacheonensis]MBM7568632.1 anti-sigma factor RsiW [Paenibacillus sacheonensis]NBC72475.1 DUF4367 domain-containing protein [Paenibacillus sacheonensis]
MTDMDHKLRGLLQEEADELLFADMELSDRLKQKIRLQAAAEKTGRRFTFKKSWTAALAAAVVLIAGFMLLQQPNAAVPDSNSVGNVSPSDGSGAGSELSQLITTPLSTAEDARSAFGSELRVPSVLPQGFALKEIVAVGMKNERARDVTFTYFAGEKTLTFMASRMDAAFPAEMFAKTKVGGEDGFVFEQPELTELYWKQDGIQYGLTGNISADEARKVAESLE